MYLLKFYMLWLVLDINIGGAEMITQSLCLYRNDGDVKHCNNMSVIDTSHRTDRFRFYTENDDGGRNYSDVSVADIRGLYQTCFYDRYDGRPDGCVYTVAVPADTEYMMCYYNLQRLHSEPFYCTTHSASRFCLVTQPSTNRLLHQTVPPTVYITGLMFNILIILVLCLKAEKSVLNSLLLMLSVWDLLYLACLVAESIIGHYTHTTQIQISDLSYSWLQMRCVLGDSSACAVLYQWRDADNNIGIRTLHYLLMYWLHVAAMVFQIASVYQTIVIATFRCIAIRWPFQASQLLTSTKAAVATGCCLLLGIAVHVPAFIAGAGGVMAAVLNCYMKYTDDDNINKFWECVSSTTTHNSLFSASNTTFTNIYHFYHVITYNIILFLALPFTLLLVLNILMLAELYQGTGSGALHDDENKAVTKVVAAIVTVFLVTYIVKPMYIVDIFYFSGNVMNGIAYQSCGGYFTVSLIITVLPALNSVINLLLYLGLRQTFRDQFSSLFNFCKLDVNPRRPEAIALQPMRR